MSFIKKYLNEGNFMEEKIEKLKELLLTMDVEVRSIECIGTDFPTQHTSDMGSIKRDFISELDECEFKNDPIFPIKVFAFIKSTSIEVFRKYTAATIGRMIVHEGINTTAWTYPYMFSNGKYFSVIYINDRLWSNILIEIPNETALDKLIGCYDEEDLK